MAALSFGGQALAENMSADYILKDANIYTADGWARALAVKDGIILAVGDDKDIRPFRSPGTKVLELDGATIFPGFHDDHVHPAGSGQLAQQCIFPQGSSLDVVLDTVADCVKARKKGEWILGGQWDAASIGQKIDRTLLDKVAPDNPVLLNDISMHSTWVNSKALALAGIAADTPNPPGGVIERDENGEATGVLRESASGYVRAVIPPATTEKKTAALKWALDYMLSQGITSFTDAGVDQSILEAYAALESRGQLKHYVRACQGWKIQSPDGEGGAPDYDQFHMNRNFYTTGLLKPDCIKLVLDGVPTDGHTAAMLAPYADAKDPHDFHSRGILMIPADELGKIVTRLDAEGFTVKMHAAGDAAVRAGIDAIAAARTTNGYTGLLHNVAHNSFVSMDDFARARKVAASFEMSPYIWYPNPIIPDIVKAVGPQRMERFTPIKGAIDSGALVVPGSDWAVVPSINPWIAIETLVTRQKPGGGEVTLGAQERLTLDRVLKLYTTNSAIMTGARDGRGALARGMQADMIVVDQNPFKIAVTDIHKTKVLMTIINGEIVYEAK